MLLSIVIPAYNEERKIERDLGEASAFLQRHSIAGEILVVDDGSRDRTREIVEASRERYPAVQLLDYGSNRGKGFATRYGMTRTRGEYAMFADAGLCVPYEMALVGLSYLRVGACDIAVANRRLAGSSARGQKLYRRIGSSINSWMVRLLMGIPWHLNDTQCGFKLFKGDVARQIYAEMSTDRMMADIEMLLRASRRGLNILNFAVPWTNDPDTRFNPFWGQLNNFRELWDIKRRLGRS